MRTWKCTVCGYIHRGEQPPRVCPACFSAFDGLFQEVEEEKPWWQKDAEAAAGDPES